MYSAKVTSASDLDDKLKQNVDVQLFDGQGAKVKNYVGSFYGTPDELRQIITDWKQNMIDKISASLNAIKNGDTF